MLCHINNYVNKFAFYKTYYYICINKILMELNNKLNSLSVITKDKKLRFSTKDSLYKSVKWSIDKKYHDLGEFKTYFQVIFPEFIKIDNAKKTIFTTLISFCSLNRYSIEFETCVKLANILNSRIVDGKLDSKTLTNIINDAFDKRFDFTPRDNSSVRFIKNKYHEFNAGEMRRETSKLKRESDFKLLTDIALNWDFLKDGNATQESLAKKMGCSRRTIIRLFKFENELKEFFEIWNELKCIQKITLVKEEVKIEKIKLNRCRKDVKIIAVRRKKLYVKVPTLNKKTECDKTYKNILSYITDNLTTLRN